MPELSQEQLEAIAQKPLMVSTPDVTTRAHDLAKIQSVADRAAANSAGAKNHLGLRFRKIVPPGATTGGDWD